MGCISICRLLCIALLCTLTISTIQVTSENIPTESECRPYIDKALSSAKVEIKEPDSAEVAVDADDSKEEENVPDGIVSDDDDGDDNNDSGTADSNENDAGTDDDSKESTNENSVENDGDNDSQEKADDNDSKEDVKEEDDNKSDEQTQDEDSKENAEDDGEDSGEAGDSNDAAEDTNSEEAKEDEDSGEKSVEQADEKDNDSGEEDAEKEDSKETDNDDGDSKEATEQDNDDSKEAANADDDSKEAADQDDDSKEPADEDSKEAVADQEDDSKENDNDADDDNKSSENSKETDADGDSKEGEATDNDDSKEDDQQTDNDSTEEGEEQTEEKIVKRDVKEQSHEVTAKSYPVEDLLLESEIPENLRDRSHINEILGLDDDSVAENEALQKVADKTLQELKRVYENAIKPLEVLYKYRDLSNRHFGDPEIFSKPLVLLMGPWSGGKSSIINYLTDNEYTDYSLKTGAEPSLPYFNILMHGESEAVLDGTQLAADWTFSGLQKFGQGLQERLRGLKLPSKLLEKVNIVEIPGILEVRKHVSRIFPFNDACQWFIDRADIIFLVYDPSKLDVGPETEAILDQLKGREYQTRIVLNKADQVHPEELLRVQGALIWNISPLMSSQQPPIMYTVSLWSHPFEENTPVRLLQAQEKALLQDLDQAIEHRIENKIASARRFAVRVRNHAKMVDCYLTTYYNHKTLFGNKKKISGEIVEHPQNYHIYEGLSTLTNISRYDLPDPEVYRDFFKLNPLYEFKKLSETCTYFRGCPINKLDVAIAYDLPELVNRYKKAVDQALNTLELSNSGSDPPTTDRR